jgi:hypothetical protein
MQSVLLCQIAGNDGEREKVTIVEEKSYFLLHKKLHSFDVKIPVTTLIAQEKLS